MDRWGGFVWICLSLPMRHRCSATTSARMPALLAPYHLDRLHLRTYLSTVLPANWKVAVDAFNEAYHVQGTHPQRSLPWTDDVSPRVRTARDPRPLRTAPQRAPSAPPQSC